MVDPYLFPARGRKLVVVTHGHEFTPLLVLIPTFSPQGDGNASSGSRSGQKIRVDPYLFPARGRKLDFTGVSPCGTRNVDPYLFPARGRKLILCAVDAIFISG